MREVRQRNVALILARELAVHLTTPMWVWDEDGVLVYVNEPAEALIGRKSRELGVGRLEELPMLQPEDLDGSPLEYSELPSGVALRERKPAHRVLRFTDLNGMKKTIAVTAYPLFVRGDEFVGAVAVFWRLPDES
jgi:PAS domain-containing protein